MALSSPIDPFIWGAGGEALTPEEIARQREIAAALLGQPDFSPVGHWTQGAARVVSALGGVLKDRRADSAEKSNLATNSGLVERLLGGMGGSAAPIAAAAPATDYASDRVAQAHASSGSRGDDIAWVEAAPYQKAFLNTLAGPESGGRYDVIYGGERFSDFSRHPGKAIRIQTGPNAGRTSSAAGKYQFLGSTWEDQAGKLGLSDFSPKSQDMAAWNLAAETFKAKTGQDLDAVLQSGDPNAIAQVGQVLSPVWTSLPSGIEQGTTNDKFVSTFQRYLAQGATPAQAANAAQAEGTQVASLDPSIGLPAASTPEADYFGEQPSTAFRDAEAAGTPMSGFAGDVPVPASSIPPPGDMALKGDRVQPSPQVAQALTAPQQAVPAGPVPSSAADRPVALPAPQRAPVAAPAPMALGGGMGGINPAIIDALSNPAASEQTRKIAGILLGQQLEQNDPMRALEMDYKRAQIGALGRKGTGEDETFFGNPVAIQGPDGNISYGQMGNRGTFRPIQLPQGQTFAPVTKTIDTGVEVIHMDQAGNVIARTPKQNFQESFDTAAGTAAGKTAEETRAEYSSIKSKMPGLYSVVDRLQDLSKTATYTAAGKLLDAAGKELGAEPREGAVARAEYTAIIDNQILPLLRDTFGAQFTAEEGQRLARTLGDPDKSPTEKSALLRAFIDQKERDLAALESRIGGGSSTPAPKQSGEPPSFTDQKAVVQAIQDGTLKIGDVIIFNGERMRVDP